MSPFKTLFLSTILASGLAASGAASATVLFQNLPDLIRNQTGDCRYNTTCGPGYFGSTYSGYGAQQFTLTQAATATSAGFNSVVVEDVFASGVNWLILAANGTGGLPGATLFSGTNTAVTHAVGPVGNLRPTTDYSFGFTPASLAAGSYYLAVQAITTNRNDFLSKGVADSGAAQSGDNGASWAAGYSGNFPSVAMSLTGTFDNNVPEPGSLALLLVGLAAIYRRKTA